MFGSKHLVDEDLFKMRESADCMAFPMFIIALIMLVLGNLYFANEYFSIYEFN